MGDPSPRTSGGQTVDAMSLTETMAEAGSAAPAGDAESARSRGEAHASLGRYVLLRQIGEGAMGVVYAAYDEELDRKVALKLIHPSHQGNSQLRARILREAQALARVSAPNVVHVYQVGEVEGQLFIAMEFVNGTTLARWQAEPGRSWQEILRMYIAAGQGLLAAHEAGLVHRDFKPDNVLIGEDGRPRVVDFGLARMETEPATQVGSLPAPSAGGGAKSASPLLTQTGVLIGTPLYMSPEQHLGEAADSRSDQFSFCVALYEALYRRPPFFGLTLESLAESILSGQIQPRPAGSHVPAPVHQALLRGLSRLREQRFPDMRDLLAALAFDPNVDRSAGPGSRRRVTISLLALGCVSGLGIELLGRFGVGPFTASVLMALTFLAVFMFLAYRFRSEMRNPFHRGTLVYGLVFSGQLLMLRLLAGLLGFVYPQLATLDLLACSATSAMMAGLLMPSLWSLVPLTAIGAVAAALFPNHAQLISSAVIAVCFVVTTLSWNLTVSARRTSQGQGQGQGRNPRKGDSGGAAAQGRSGW